MAQTPSTTATVTYADAGVDIDRANRTKKRIKYLAHKTFTRGVLSEIGGFRRAVFHRPGQVSGPGAGFERGRGRHQAENRL